MSKKNILNYCYLELAQEIEAIGEKSFRASQIFEWIYKKGVLSFLEMKNIPENLRRVLDEKFVIQSLNGQKTLFSLDGTKKVLFSLRDDEQIETVLIPTKKRATLCISTQAGCKFGCQFCASGLLGFKRNLECSEIVGQILLMKEMFKEAPITHIVFMGVGEPFDNYDALMKAIGLINSKEGFHIAKRRITISTCGLVPGIERFAKESLQVELAISLHASNDELRNKLMPVNKKYPLKELMVACRGYYKKTNRQITFEYLMIKDFTCNETSARELKSLLRGFDNKLNLICYNEVSEFDYKAPTKQEIYSFQKSLDAAGILSVIRTPRGTDIAAACGQLRIN